MGLFSAFKKATKNATIGGTNKIQSLTKIEPEIRLQIEDMLSEGFTPQEIAQEFQEIHILAVYAINRNMKRRNDRVRSYRKDNNSSDEVQKIEKQIELEELRARLEAVRADREYERKKRELELEIKAAELEAKRAELYEDEAELISPDGEPNLWAFLSTLLTRGPRQPAGNTSPLAQPAQPIHTSQTTLEEPPEVSREMIQAELAKATPEQREQLRTAPEAMVRAGIKAKYPQLHDSQINVVMQELRT
jgi:uncharacterized protein (DUF433 family)